MGTDITARVEVFVDGEWKIARGKNEYLVDFLKQKLKTIQEDDVMLLESEFDGTISELENDIKESSNTADWLFIRRDYLLFALLSDVRNDDYDIIPFTEPDYDLFNVEGKTKEVEELEKYDDFFHSYSVIELEDESGLMDLIDANYEYKRISETESEHLKKVIRRIFNQLKEKKKETNASDVRLFVCYDN